MALVPVSFEKAVEYTRHALERMEQALERLQSLNRLYPDQYYLEYYEGVCYARLGDQDSAIDGNGYKGFPISLRKYFTPSS